MKAVRFVGIKQPLEEQEIPVPGIGETDVLIKVMAAGICHSDVHYRNGVSPVGQNPLTFGHEIAGIVEKAGKKVKNVRPGDRVCLHYLITCGDCPYCVSGNEQFCPEGKMLGHHTDGGYAEYIAVPSRNALVLPGNIPFEQGATLMCASATANHALRKAKVRPGNKVAIFGVGGLGQSAVQLAKVYGATEVYAIDINPEKLNLAEKHGAIPVNSREVNPVKEIREKTNGKGVDAAIEFIGLPQTQKQALQSLAPMGRVVLVGLSNKDLPVDVYHEVLGGEVEIIGSNDHQLKELPALLEFVTKGLLDVSHVVTQKIPLNAGAINKTLDALEKFESGVRTVIVPSL